jgi:thiol-disulfide isomerase/thioredoxin
MKIGDNFPGKLPEIIGSKITLVHFWSITCPVCKANFELLVTLANSYDAELFAVIPIHMPLGEWELDEDKVRDTAQKFGILENLFIDNNHILANHFEVEAVPTYFLFGWDGTLRRRASGGFGLKMIEQALIRLLREPNAD